MVVVLACAAPAFSQSPTEDTHGGLAGSQQGGGGGVDAADSGGSLPFTGLQIALIAGAGAGVLGMGVALRRASRFR